MRKIMRLSSALLPIICAVTLNSCLADKYGTDPGENSESVTFKISVPANAQPGTRALLQSDEYAVKDVSVLAFDKTAKTLRGRYAGRIVSGPTHTGGASAEMTFEVSLPRGDFDLMIVANGNKIMADKSAALVTGASQSSVEDALTMNMTTAGWNTNTGNADYYGMPMWGYIKAVAVPGGSPIGTIYLTRMIAKVDIQLNSSVIADGKFKLYSARVYNYVEQGRLIPYTGGAFDWTAVNQGNLAGNQTPSLPAGYTKANPYAPDNKYIDYTAASPYHYLKNEIYLFEAPVGVAPASNGNYISNTCLVVGGSYDNGPTTYYRIDFAKQTDATLTTYTYLPILRNNSYTVTISGVSGHGHANPGEALESAPANITAHVLDWNNENITTIMTDGVYMLGVSQSRFELSGEARTTASADNLLTIVTDHSAGWAATVWADEAGTTPTPGNWLRLTHYNGNGNYPNGNDIQLILDTNGTTGDREAYIHIKAGILNYIIKVVQKKALALRIIDVLTGQEISSLSFNSKTSLIGVAPTPRQVRVEWTPVEQAVNVVRTPGSAPLTWASACPATITGGAYVFTINPAGISPGEVNGNPFISKTATLNFQVGSTSEVASLAIDQTHYALYVTGLKGGYSLATKTATIKANGDWTSSVVQTPTTVLATNNIPASAAANTAGANYTYSFSGTIGEAEFTFKSQMPGLFDDVVITVEGGVIAPLFAKSNIVMFDDGAGNKVLTFAETSADNTNAKTVYHNGTGISVPAMPANIMGIHFRGASLIGVTSNGTHNTPWTSNAVVFVPEDYTGTIPATWTHAFLTSNGKAPSVPYRDGGGAGGADDYDYFKAYGNGTGYDLTMGWGDICRYISDKGWVEERWRLPTLAEFKMLLNETYDVKGRIYGAPVDVTITGTGTGGRYGYLTISYAHMLGIGATAVDGAEYLTDPGKYRVVFPAAGIRDQNGPWWHPGGQAAYFSGTPDVSGYWAGWVLTGNINRDTFVGNAPGRYSSSVRCILDD